MWYRQTYSDEIIQEKDGSGRVGIDPRDRNNFGRKRVNSRDTPGFKHKCTRKTRFRAKPQIQRCRSKIQKCKAWVRTENVVVLNIGIMNFILLENRLLVRVIRGVDDFLNESRNCSLRVHISSVVAQDQLLSLRIKDIDRGDRHASSKSHVIGLFLGSLFLSKSCSVPLRCDARAASEPPSQRTNQLPYKRRWIRREISSLPKPGDLAPGSACLAAEIRSIIVK